MSSDVKVGIVIPNHNYGKWIKRALYSVIEEPYPNKQIAVIDDGSTDDSWAIICKELHLKDIADHKRHEGYIDNIPAIAYRYTKAGGPSRARNTGIKMLWESTHLYGFLDSDDEYLPGKIGKSVEKFAADPMHIGAIYTDYHTINESGDIRREYKEPFSKHRLLQECIVHSACMVNKLALQTCGMYDEEMRTCEDYDLWMRISERFVLIHIPESLMLVRVGSHSSTATVNKEIWEENWKRVMLKAQARAQYG